MFMLQLNVVVCLTTKPPKTEEENGFYYSLNVPLENYDTHTKRI